MRTIIAFATAAFAAATLSAGVAIADDQINVTPPITREHARAIRAMHPASELNVVPQPVPASRTPGHVSTAEVRMETAQNEAR